MRAWEGMIVSMTNAGVGVTVYLDGTVRCWYRSSYSSNNDSCRNYQSVGVNSGIYIHHASGHLALYIRCISRPFNSTFMSGLTLYSEVPVVPSGACNRDRRLVHLCWCSCALFNDLHQLGSAIEHVCTFVIVLCLWGLVNVNLWVGALLSWH